MNYSVCVVTLLASQNTVDLDAQKEHHSSSDLRREIHSRDDHDYCASGTVQYVRRRLEISQMSQQAQVSHRILKLDSKCLGSLHFNYIGSMMAS